MGLHKGMTNNKNGRPTGSKNKTTNELRKMITDFVTDKWARVHDDFESLEPKERLQFFEKLMQYTLPKLQSVEYSEVLENQIERLSDEDLTALLNELTERIESN